jgi:hypothetical protein
VETETDGYGTLDCPYRKVGPLFEALPVLLNLGFVAALGWGATVLFRAVPRISHIGFLDPRVYSADGIASPTPADDPTDPLYHGDGGSPDSLPADAFARLFKAACVAVIAAGSLSSFLYLRFSYSSGGCMGSCMREHI